MSIAVLHPALLATALAMLLSACTSSPASSTDADVSADVGTPPAQAPIDPAQSPDPAPSTDMTDTIANGQPFTMQSGGTVTLSDGSTLNYVGVREDSRCPPGRQCIWAGDAVVAFDWSSAEVLLHTGKEPRSHLREGLTLNLKSLARGDAPEAQLLVDSAQ